MKTCETPTLRHPLALLVDLGGILFKVAEGLSEAKHLLRGVTFEAQRTRQNSRLLDFFKERGTLHVVLSKWSTYLVFLLPGV